MGRADPQIAEQGLARVVAEILKCSAWAGNSLHLPKGSGLPWTTIVPQPSSRRVTGGLAKPSRQGQAGV